LDNSGCKK